MKSIPGDAGEINLSPFLSLYPGILTVNLVFATSNLFPAIYAFWSVVPHKLPLNTDGKQTPVSYKLGPGSV